MWSDWDNLGAQWRLEAQDIEKRDLSEPGIAISVTELHRRIKHQKH